MLDSKILKLAIDIRDSAKQLANQTANGQHLAAHETHKQLLRSLWLFEEAHRTLNVTAPQHTIRDYYKALNKPSALEELQRRVARIPVDTDLPFTDTDAKSPSDLGTLDAQMSSIRTLIGALSTGIALSDHEDTVLHVVNIADHNDEPYLSSMLTLMLNRPMLTTSLHVEAAKADLEALYKMLYAQQLEAQNNHRQT